VLITAVRIAEAAPGWHRLAAIVAESYCWQLGLSTPDVGDGLFADDVFTVGSVGVIHLFSPPLRPCLRGVELDHGLAALFNDSLNVFSEDSNC
jgi:hypothetical protein